MAELVAKRDLAAARILPKTGDHSIDSEAIVVQSCLSRIAENTAVQRLRSNKVSRVMLRPDGKDSIDISYRTHLGSVPPSDGVDQGDLDPNDDSVDWTPLRSDIVVAQSAMQRLMRIASDALKSSREFEQKAEELKAARAETETKAALLSAENAELRARLLEYEDARSCYDLYRSAWKKEAVAIRAAYTGGGTASSELRKKDALDALIKKKVDALGAARRVSRARALLNRTTDYVAKKFERDDDLFEMVQEVFRPEPAIVREITVGEHAAEREEAKAKLATADEQAAAKADQRLFDEELLTAELTSGYGSGAGVRYEASITPQAAGLDHQGGDGSAIDGVLDHIDDILDAEQVDEEEGGGLSANGSATNKAGAPHHDELIVTRRVRSGARFISRLDAGTTYVGVLLNALRYAPSQYTGLCLNLTDIIGRTEQLARQAKEAGIPELWAEIAQSIRPVVYIAQCNPPKPEDTDEAFVRSKHLVLLSRSKDALSPAERETDADLPRLLAYRRAPLAAEGHPLVAPSIEAAEAPPQSVTVRQHPGIVSTLGLSNAGNRINLISEGLVRCYSSTMFPSCAVDALITPYVDFHNPFFMTQDAPGQYVQIAFSKVAIAPTAYSFASVHPTQGGYYPRSWRLEGSLDGVNWRLLRRHVNDETLNRYHPVGLFDLPANGDVKYYSSFRVVQEGRNAKSSLHLNVSSFEMYGRAMYVREVTVEPSAMLPIRMARPSRPPMMAELPAQPVPPKKGSKKKKK